MSRLAHPVVRIAALLGCLAALFALYFGVSRPWLLRWGATDAEVSMPLPGDEIIRAPVGQTTRAITIAAPPAVVWAWVAQMGQDRGGFYSYRVLENIVGANMPSVEVLDPRLQLWRAGDRLWMYPPEKVGGAGSAVLLRLDQGRALVFGTHQIGTAPAAAPDGTWAFVVLPAEAEGTPDGSRLLFRGRGAGGLHLFAAAFNLAVFEPVHFAMERKTLIGIDTLAEGGRLSPARDALQVTLWAVTFLGFVVSGVLVLVARQPGWHLMTFLGCGLLFQLLTLVQPSPFIGLALVVATIRPRLVVDAWEQVC